jgi:hypothetical protein
LVEELLGKCACAGDTWKRWLLSLGQRVCSRTHGVVLEPLDGPEQWLRIKVPLPVLFHHPGETGFGEPPSIPMLKWQSGIPVDHENTDCRQPSTHVLTGFAPCGLADPVPATGSC